MKVYIGKYPKDERGRKVEVRIDKEDIWNLDHTLALVIHPALVRLQMSKTGSPYVDNGDVRKSFVLHRTLSRVQLMTNGKIGGPGFWVK